MSCRSRRLLLGLACVLGLSPWLAGAADTKTPSPAAKYFKGEVVPLADVIAKTGSRLDPDAAPYWLALVSEGAIYPLVKDSGARMFFQDPALLKRPMRLTGRLLPGSQLLQVTAVHSYLDGELHEVYYWCDICSIRRSAKTVCECCGGPMELRFEPVKQGR
jgi:hypothetical protein